MKATYKIAKYLRISAEDIDLDGFDKYESNSIQNQRNLLDDFISKIPEFQGCEVVEELDDGKMGTNFSRNGVQKLIQMAEKGEIDCIIVKDLSRWGRSHIEVGDFLEQKFPAWNVRFISINDGYDSANLNGGTAGIDIAFRNLIYELYSQDLSEKVRSGKMSAAKSGKCVNSYAFYGYAKDPNNLRSLIIDEPAAAVVRRIYELAEQNYTPTQIAKILNDDGVKTPQERKMELGLRRRWTKSEQSFWYASIISVIIRDERYTGKWIYGKKKTIAVGQQKQKAVPKDEWVVVPDAIPAIISEEQFKAARANISKRCVPERKQSKSSLLFSRKIVCGCCGKALKTVHRKDYVKYFCSTPNVTDKYRCSNEKFLEKKIADTVLKALQYQIALANEVKNINDEMSAKQISNIDKLHGEILRLQRLVDKSKTDKISLWEKYHAGKISAEGFQKDNEEADEKAKQIEGKIKLLHEEKHNLEILGKENAFVEQYSKYVGLKELTKEVVEHFVREVKVFSTDKIEIVFNFADEYAMIR